MTARERRGEGPQPARRALVAAGQELTRSGTATRLGVLRMHPFRKSFRGGAVLAIVAAAVVLLPGIAWAGNQPGLPAPVVPKAGAAPFGGMPGTGGTGGTAGSNGDSFTPNAQSGADPAAPAAPSFSPPGGFSPECQAHVQAHVQADLTKAIQDVPATIQAIVNAIMSGLGRPPSPPTISITDPVSGVTYIIQFLSS